MRICDLAKELMTTGKELLALLQARGCSARSTQANLTPDLEQYLRDEIKRLYYAPAPAPAAPEPAAPAAERGGEGTHGFFQIDVAGAAESAAAAVAALERAPAELVVARTQFGAREDLVALGGFLEFFLGFLVARIAVRVVLHGQLAVGLLDLVLRGAAVEAEHFVAIALLAHGNPGAQSAGPEETTTCAARRSLSPSL